MRLSPRDIDKLMLHGAGFLAQKRLWRGVRLNYPETVALIASQLLEFIRDGRDVATLMDLGKQLLGRAQVMSGVPEMVDEVQVEGTFPDGTKLVTVHAPICLDTCALDLALYGSGLSLPSSETEFAPSESIETPGAVMVLEGDIALNAGSETISLEVINLGNRPIQVGSHYPFFETNASLRFDRGRAMGFRLDIPSGTAVRFEPGDRKMVRLTALGGKRLVYGGSGLIMGAIEGPNSEAALRRAEERGFLDGKVSP